MNPEIKKPMKEELEILKRQLQSAIESEYPMFPMSDEAIREGVQKYGQHVICVIGDYVIARRT